MFDMEDHLILRYDSFWSATGISGFVFLVCSLTLLLLVYSRKHKVLQRWLDENGRQSKCSRICSLSRQGENFSGRDCAIARDLDQRTPTAVHAHDTGIITWWISRRLISGQRLDATVVNWTGERNSAAHLLHHAALNVESSLLGIE